MYKAWQQEKNYDYLDPTGRFRHGQGVLPVGTRVRFANGAIGKIIWGGIDRSLVEHRTPVQSGCTRERDWYPNTDLEVPVSAVRLASLSSGAVNLIGRIQ